MGVKIKKTDTSKSAKVPSHRWSNEDIIKAATAVNNDVKPQDAVKEMLISNPDLLAEYGLTLASYDKPGQTMSAIRSEVGKRVKTDAKFREAAIAADIWEPDTVPVPVPVPVAVPVAPVVKPALTAEEEVAELIEEVDNFIPHHER